MTCFSGSFHEAEGQKQRNMKRNTFLSFSSSLIWWTWTTTLRLQTPADQMELLIDRLSVLNLKSHAEVKGHSPLQDNIIKASPKERESNPFILDERHAGWEERESSEREEGDSRSSGRGLLKQNRTFSGGYFLKFTRYFTEKVKVNRQIVTCSCVGGRDSTGVTDPPERL